MSNLCPNPSLVNNETGWANGTRTAVSGFDRPYAKRYTGSTATSFIGAPQIAVTPGQQITFSFSTRSTAAITLRVYVDYFNGATASGDSGAKNVSIPANTVTRAFSTVTIPSGINGAMLSVYFNLPANNTVLDVTMARYTLGTDTAYFDGASPNWQWMGAAGNSASQPTTPTVQPSGIKIWNGTTWADAPKQKFYNGTAWV